MAVPNTKYDLTMAHSQRIMYEIILMKWHDKNPRDYHLVNSLLLKSIIFHRWILYKWAIIHDYVKFAEGHDAKDVLLGHQFDW